MTDIEELDRLDQATITLLFVLRDSLADVSPLDFWNGRAFAALSAAAAEADNAGHAITRAARKLQIISLPGAVAARVKAVTEDIDRDYRAWQQHIARNLIQIIALAYAERDQHKRGKKPADTTDKPGPVFAPAKTTTDKEPLF